MTRLIIQHPNGQYPLVIAKGVIGEAGAAVAGLSAARCAVITNSVVRSHHGAALAASLDDAGIAVTWLEVPDGERHKTLASVNSLYRELVSVPWERGFPIVALGGGVVGDIAGFVAATLLRGVPFIQVPTTLLAMVDSSIGGKVGVDLPEGKNLVGAFKQPHAVFIDPLLLGTLPIEEMRAGMAEVIKHGILGSPPLFDLLERGDEDLSEMLRLAISVKAAIVEEDPFERGRRAVLNLGHTFGHAIERLLGYEIRHGEAVAMGIACATRLAVSRGVCSRLDADRILALLTMRELPTQPPRFSAEEVFGAMASDKKREKGQIRAILPRGIGEVEIVPSLTLDDVAVALTK